MHNGRAFRGVGLRLGLGAVLAVATAGVVASGCGEVDGQTSAPEGVEVTRSALSALARGPLQAVFIPPSTVMAVWIDNRDPVTLQPTSTKRAWGMTINETTGAVRAAHVLVNDPRQISSARLAVNGSQILLVYNVEFTTIDHDVMGLFLDTNSNAVGFPFAIDNSGLDDFGGIPAFDPTNQRYFVTFERAGGSLRGKYVSPAGVALPDPVTSNNFTPVGTSQAVESDTLFAVSRFVTASRFTSAFVTTTGSGAGTPTTTTNLGANIVRPIVDFDPATRTVGVVAQADTAGTNVHKIVFRPFSTDACFGVPGCFVDEAALMTVNSPIRPAVAMGRVGTNFVTLVLQSPDSLSASMKVFGQEPSGFISGSRTFFSDCSVETVGDVVGTSGGNGWLFYFGCNWKVRAQRINALGAALSGELTFVN